MIGRHFSNEMPFFYFFNPNQRLQGFYILDVIGKRIHNKLLSEPGKATDR